MFEYAVRIAVVYALLCGVSAATYVVDPGFGTLIFKMGSAGLVVFLFVLIAVISLLTAATTALED